MNTLNTANTPIAPKEEKQVIAYKLLKQDMTSYGGMIWELGKTNRARDLGAELCSPDLLHCYSDPRIAVIMNSAHASITTPRLFRIACSRILASDGLKQGCKEQTILEEMILPEISQTQKIAFGILCALKVYEEYTFVVWAKNWLNNIDRSASSAYAASASAYASAYASPSASSAYASAYAASAYAASAYAYASDYASSAASSAASTRGKKKNIDFLSLLNQAMEIS